MTEKTEIVDEILNGVEVIFRQVFPLAHKELLELDLTAPQLKIVLLLFLYDKTRMSDLASSLGVTMATATGIVDRLVERGLVARENHPTDRRVVMCDLTAKGLEQTNRLWKTSSDKARQILLNIELSKLKLVAEALSDLTAVGALQESSVRKQ